MSLPVKASAPAAPGMLRSAALMRALGQRASAVWSALSSSEATQLSTAMDALNEDSAAAEAEAARAYLKDLHTAPEAGSVWDRLANQDTAKTAPLLAGERPQIVAVILSRLPSRIAAELVRDLPPQHATLALRHLLHLGRVTPAALSTIETMLQHALMTTATTERAGTERLAQIFDNLDTRFEQGLLAALDNAEPGLGERIRGLMFTFDDIAHLDPASLQTILASIDRSVLVLALKGARPETAEAFHKNMTQRARELLQSEIEMLGPVRRADIEAARSDLTALARGLVKRGDILINPADDELVE
ncbi:MAG: FliG C-terminal domain-containing protein [Pseudomonadota bacterium]